MAKNQAFRGIKLLYIFLTVTPTDSACFAWGVDLTKRLDILVGFLSRLDTRTQMPNNKDITRIVIFVIEQKEEDRRTNKDFLPQTFEANKKVH